MKFEIVPRKQLGPKGWNMAADAAPAAWWWNREEWVDYSLAYCPGAIDRSFAVAMDGNIVCIASLVVKERRVQNGGQPYAAAPAFLFAGPMTDAVLRTAQATHAEANKWADDNDRVMMRPINNMNHVPPAPPGYRMAHLKTWVTDLRGGEASLLPRYRKSYRQAAKKNTYDIVVHGGAAEAIVVAHALHVTAAGRETRDGSTWKLMGDWLANGHAVLAVAYKDTEPVGYAYVIRYKTWAYYASGATLVDDVGHALQHEAMRALAADGATQFYELGYDAGPNADEKERGIALFKSGFGGRLWNVPALDIAPAIAGPRGGLHRVL